MVEIRRGGKVGVVEKEVGEEEEVGKKKEMREEEEKK